MTSEQDCGDIPGTDIPNNTYGWGQVDAWAAMHDFDIKKTASHRVVSPGDLITYTLAITHTGQLGDTHNVVISDTLPDGTHFIDASEPYHRIDGVIDWDFDTFSAGEAKSVNLVVQVANTTSWMIRNDAYGVSSDDVSRVTGPPVIAFNSGISIWLPTVFHEFSPP